MADKSKQFPEAERLYQGAILASIVHAVMVASAPDMAHEMSWDESNYNLQDSAGGRATISFSDKGLVGVFFDHESPRNPLGHEVEYDLQSFFKGMPDELYSLAFDDALQYVLDEYEGETLPVITSAFWGRAGERLAAAEPWPAVYEHGAHLARIQLMGAGDDALAAWREEWEMTPEQVALVKSIFERKMSAPDKTLRLTEQERDLIEEQAGGGEGMDESRESFSEIGIILPE